MIPTEGKDFDIILVSGEYYVDHPLSGIGVVAKILEEKGYSVGIIEKPDWKSNKDFLKLGKPKLFFGITSGAMDSMICNYTPLKKKRKDDPYEPYDSGMPDRAVLVYCNKIKELFEGVPIVIGGVESSLRRFTHYDYWSNKLRKSILIDSRADILVYGPGEKQIVKIADRLKNGNGLKGIEGTCIISDSVPKGFIELPFDEGVNKDKRMFCKMQLMFSNYKNLAQRYGNRYVLQHKAAEYTTKDLDYIYGLDYSRNIPKKYPEFKAIQFSVITHRGCIGRCNFCSVTLLQGDKIISRSEESILNEIRRLTKHKDFKGYIDDLGGPSANMYGMDCDKCESWCIKCTKLDLSHSRLSRLLERARKIKGVKKIFVRSGIRYDLAVNAKKYIENLSKHHISGCLKIAPEHFSDKVLKLMNKDNLTFEEFKKYFERINKPLKQSLKYYFIVGCPGETIEETKRLAKRIKELKNTESIQIFTPTPMTVSTCMYYTGMSPYTLEKIYVPYNYNEKKRMKNLLFGKII